MKVKDLIEQLQEVDPEAEVIMAKDSEGNDYTPLSDFWEGAYVPETTYYGQVYETSLSKGLERDDIRIPGEDEDAVAAIILSPTW